MEVVVRTNSHVESQPRRQRTIVFLVERVEVWQNADGRITIALVVGDDKLVFMADRDAAIGIYEAISQIVFRRYDSAARHLGSGSNLNGGPPKTDGPSHVSLPVCGREVQDGVVAPPVSPEPVDEHRNLC